MKAYDKLVGIGEIARRYTLTNLNHSRIGQASRAAVIIVAIVDGLSPLLAALTVLLPFFVVQLWPTLSWPIMGFLF